MVHTQVFGVWLNTEEYPDAKMPYRAHSYDAGYDLFAAESFNLECSGNQSRKVIHTGVHLQMEHGWEA